MKRFIVLALILTVSSVAAFAAVKKNSQKMPSISNESTATSGDLTGKTAIGGTGFGNMPGFGIRYWMSDQNAIDGNISFSSAKDTSQMGLGGSYDTIIKRTTYLKFMWLIGLQYTSNSQTIATTVVIPVAPFVVAGTATQTQTDINIGAGLGVEYSFQEIPELSFDAFLTGVGIDMRSFSGGGDSQTLFATNPGLGFAVRYYIK